MFKIDNNTFHVTWGDKGSFDLTFEDYTFQIGDEVYLKVYEEDGMDEEPVLNKKVIVDAETDVVTMDLLKADTKLGDPSNEKQTYWYEITLGHNGSIPDQTPFCFDDKGPKIFYIYPGGVE